VASAALTPELALRYLAEFSTDVRAAMLLGADGSVAASDPDDPEAREALRDGLAMLIEAADLRPGTDPVAEIEVMMPAGSLFVVRRGGWVLAAVAGRYALSSLMRYDLNRVLGDLAEGGS